MVKPSLSQYSEKIAKIPRKESLDILFMLREHTCRFKDLPGNSFTKSKRLKELRFSGLIEPTIIEEGRKGRAVVGYRLTEKGVSVLDKIDGLLKVL
jgi:DNA-binding HxlR family transcriptional regulator